MIAILGIDAAWTANKPSGVALLRGNIHEKPECVAACCCYGDFLVLGTNARDHSRASNPHYPNPRALLRAAHELAGVAVSVVAVDMPIAADERGNPAPVTRRREADNAISRAFGARWCGTHSPTVERPGEIGMELNRGFGMPVGVVFRIPAIIEVYPHVALLDLLGCEKRFPYKAEKRYKPPLSLEEIARQHETILGRLREEIDAVPDCLAKRPVRRELKASEDTLDGLISAWVGWKYAKGEARAYGDETAAIWVPV